MKVLVTGAAGNLGRVLLPELTQRGHEARAADARPLETDAEFVQLDLRERSAAEAAVDSVDAIVHGAALHGVHVATREPHEFWDTNVEPTFTLLEAARAAGVSRFVLCSSMAVYGESAERTDDSWAIVTDESPARPKDVYGLSKLLCEELARYYARVHGVTGWALRLGMFVPETFERYGFRLLFGGVDDRDVAHAVMRALEVAPPGGFDTANVMAATPLTDEDAAAVVRDPAAVVDRHWPGTSDLVAQRGLDLGELIWGWALWRVEKAKRVLGYEPRHGFAEFLEAFRAGDEAYYPFAGLPQWGVD
jgi:nucleoside-diphosphate-sugar epimerase